MKIDKFIFKNFLLFIILFLFSSTSQLKTEQVETKKDYKALEEFVVKENDLIKLGKYQEAIIELEKKLLLQPNNPAIFALLGKSYDKLNNKDKSLDYLTKAITEDRNYPKSYNTLALIKGKENKFQETINLLDAAIKLDSNYAEALSNRGVAKGALNRNIEAVKDFTKAIEIDPFLSDAYINRGITYELLGNTFSACEDWETAASLGRKEPEKWFNKQCKNSLENKLSKQIKLTNSLRNKNINQINNFNKEREENLKKINNFNKEKEENLKTINQQKSFIELSSNKLTKLEEKLDSLLNEQKEGNLSYRENNNKLEELISSSKKLNDSPTPLNISLDSSSTSSDKSVISSNKSNITSNIKSKSTPINTNRILIFSNILVLFIIIFYLYFKYIRKSKLRQTIQKKQLNLLISNVDSLNKKLTNNEKKIRKTLSKKRKIDDSLNDQININNLIDEERSEVLFKIKEIQNEFNKANKKISSDNENITKETFDKENFSIDIENLDDIEVTNKDFTNDEEINNSNKNSTDKEKVESYKKVNLKKDTPTTKQNKKTIEVEVSSNKTYEADDLKKSDHNFSSEEKLNSESSDNNSDKLIFKNEQESIIELLTNFDFILINTNELKDSFLKNDFKLMYENDFFKLFFNFDCLLNKFLINLFKLNAQSNSNNINDFLVNYINDYLNKLLEKISAETLNNDPSKSLITLIYIPNQSFFEKMNKINSNFLSNVSFEKKIFICNKSLLKKMLEEVSIHKENKEENTLDLTIKYIEYLNLNKDLAIKS